MGNQQPVRFADFDGNCNCSDDEERWEGSARQVEVAECLMNSRIEAGTVEGTQDDSLSSCGWRDEVEENQCLSLESVDRGTDVNSNRNMDEDGGMTVQSAKARKRIRDYAMHDEHAVDRNLQCRPKSTKTTKKTKRTKRTKGITGGRGRSTVYGHKKSVDGKGQGEQGSESGAAFSQNSFVNLRSEPPIENEVREGTKESGTDPRRVPNPNLGLNFLATGRLASTTTFTQETESSLQPQQRPICFRSTSQVPPDSTSQVPQDSTSEVPPDFHRNVFPVPVTAPEITHRLHPSPPGAVGSMVDTALPTSSRLLDPSFSLSSSYYNRLASPLNFSCSSDPPLLHPLLHGNGSSLGTAATSDAVPVRCGTSSQSSSNCFVQPLPRLEEDLYESISDPRVRTRLCEIFWQMDRRLTAQSLENQKLWIQVSSMEAEIQSLRERIVVATTRLPQSF